MTVPDAHYKDHGILNALVESYTTTVVAPANIIG